MTHSAPIEPGISVQHNQVGAALRLATAQIVCRRSLWLALTLGALGCAGAQTTPPEVAATSLCIRGARVFDGERDRGVLDVRVEAGRITALGVAICAGARDGLVDGTGQTLLPGLIDAHSHNGGDSLRVMAQFGVTTTLDMAANASWAATQRAEQGSLAAGSSALQRADLFSPGPPATVPGGHGTEYGQDVPTMSAPEDVAAWLRDRRAEGADYVKVIYEHGAVIQHPVPTFDAATLRALVAATRAAGMRSIAHISTVAEALEFVAAGGHGLAHVYHDRVATTDELAKLRNAGTFVVPTLVVYAPDYGLRAGAALLDDAAFIAPLDRAARINLGQTRRQRPRHEVFAAVPMAAVRALADAGVPILAGSDAPNAGTAYGASLHQELAMLVQAGLSTSAALAAATSAPAKAFGLQDRGIIAVGKRADLVLVRGDALRDIGATRRLAAIWKRGVRIERRAAPVEGDALDADALLGGTSARAGVAAKDILPEAQASTDAVQGGSSSATLTRAAAGEAPGLHVAAETRANDKGPSWAGVVWWPTGKAFEPADLRGMDLHIRLRGDGKPLRLMVFLAGRGARPQTIWLPTSDAWQEHRLHMEELGTDGRGVTGVMIAAAPEAGSSAFSLDAWRLIASR